MSMLTGLHGSFNSNMGFVPSSGTSTRPGAPAQQTSMKKVALLVGIAIVVFMAFTAYSVRKEIQGGVKLTAIKELYFPVLQRLDANIVRVDKLEATFIEVAVTGDRDLFDKAKDVTQEADVTYAEILKLDPNSPADIKQLRNDLQRYR